MTSGVVKQRCLFQQGFEKRTFRGGPALGGSCPRRFSAIGYVDLPCRRRCRVRWPRVRTSSSPASSPKAMPLIASRAAIACRWSRSSVVRVGPKPSKKARPAGRGGRPRGRQRRGGRGRGWPGRTRRARSRSGRGCGCRGPRGCCGVGRRRGWGLGAVARVRPGGRPCGGPSRSRRVRGRPRQRPGVARPCQAGRPRAPGDVEVRPGAARGGGGRVAVDFTFVVRGQVLVVRVGAGKGGEDDGGQGRVGGVEFGGASRAEDGCPAGVGVHLAGVELHRRVLLDVPGVAGRPGGEPPDAGGLARPWSSRSGTACRSR